MPAKRLDVNYPSHHEVGAVVGVHALHLDPQAVEHIGLLAEDSELEYGKDAKVHHLSTLNRLRPWEVAKIRAHVVAWLDSLDQLDRDRLKNFFEDMRSRVSRVRFLALPHFEEEPDPRNGSLRIVKCSCVGILLQALQVALNHKVLDPHSSRFPATDLKTLQKIFDAQDLGHMTKAGLAGNGPWSVVLPGHLIHALDSDPSQWPYVPKVTDYRFP